MSEIVKILGNQRNISHLADARALGKLSHAYIINGEAGSGKKTFANYIAAALQCDRHPDLAAGPCMTCPSCIKAATDNHPDIIWVQHEKAGLISVAEVRGQVIDDISIKPYYGPYKIYIISDCQYMNEFGQNALLKTIEEPPAYGIILLLTDNADSLLDTIRSRCIRLDMDRLPSAMIEDILIRQKGLDAAAAKSAAGFARGNLGKALELAEGGNLAQLKSFTEEILRNLNSKDAFELFKAGAELDRIGGMDVLDITRKWYRDVLVIKSTGSREDLYFPNEIRALKEQAERISFEGLNNIMNDIDEARQQLEFSVKAEAVFENMFLRIRRNGKSSRN